MPKQTRSKKKQRTEPHMIVRELPDGLREVTVDGHTWIEGLIPPNLSFRAPSPRRRIVISMTRLVAPPIPLPIL